MCLYIATVDKGEKNLVYCGSSTAAIAAIYHRSRRAAVDEGEKNLVYCGSSTAPIAAIYHRSRRDAAAPKHAVVGKI